MLGIHDRNILLGKSLLRTGLVNKMNVKGSGHICSASLLGVGGPRWPPEVCRTQPWDELRWGQCFLSDSLPRFAQEKGVDLKTTSRTGEARALRNELVFPPFLRLSVFLCFCIFLETTLSDYAVYLSLLNSDLHLTLTCCSFLTPSCTWGCAGRILLPSSPFRLSVSSFQLSKRIGSDNVFVPSSGSEFCVTKSSSGLGQVVILNLSMCLEDGIRWWKPDYPRS